MFDSKINQSIQFNEFKIEFKNIYLSSKSLKYCHEKSNLNILHQKSDFPKLVMTNVRKCKQAMPIFSRF